MEEISSAARSLSPSTVERTCRHFFLFMNSGAVLSMVFYTVITGGLELKGFYALYPYLIAFCLFVMTFPVFLSVAGKKDAKILLLLLLALPVIFFYHVVVLEESASDVLYIMRFYYGMFILFYGFVAFFFWVDIGARVMKAWVLFLVETVIILSFFLSTTEFAGLYFGFLSPEGLWWIKSEYYIRSVGLALAMDVKESVRAQGLASNAAVLGGFSVFVTLYYYGLVEQSLRFKNIVILLMGVSTVFLSRSGTGLLIFVVSIVMLVLRMPRFKGVKKRSLLPLLGFPLAAYVIFSLRQGDRRLSDQTLAAIQYVAQATFGFFGEKIAASGIGGYFFGVMNLYQLNQPGKESFLPVGASWYDFSLFTFTFETGLIGLFAYLYSFLCLMKLAVPRQDFVVRWSFITLFLSALHYPVCFWVCSQSMIAVLLAAGIYMQRKERQKSLWAL